jgi:hypothetical protein
VLATEEEGRNRWDDDGLPNASWIDESDVQLLIEGKILLFFSG